MVDEDASTGADLAVIGGGPAGYVAAIRAGQLGLDVTLVEKEAVGGTCLNYGCIPSKALITASDVGHEATHAEDMGVEAEVSYDLERMVDWKDGVVDRLTSGVEQLCDANGVDVVEGRAEFADEHELRVVDEGGEDAGSVAFERAVVATGSRAIEIPGFSYDDDPVIDSRQALSLDAVPDELVVVGAGYIGMELSTVYAKLGSDVTVVEMLDQVLPGYGADVAEVVRERAEELGIDFHFGQTADEWEADGDGVVVRTEAESDDGDGLELPAEKALVAVGREPVTDTLNLEAIGLEPNDDGRLETDERGRTEVEHVFAVGDVAPGPMLAHKGMHEGEVVAEVAAGEPAAMDYQAVPAAVFTDPEIGTVGVTEAEAEDEGFDAVSGTFPLQSSGRALTMDETDGFVRVVADEDEGYLLGAQVVAPEASELVAELGLAVEMGATLEDVASAIHTHPTLSEATMEACEKALGHAIHTLNR